MLTNRIVKSKCWGALRGKATKLIKKLWIVYDAILCVKNGLYPPFKAFNAHPWCGNASLHTLIGWLISLTFDFNPSFDLGNWLWGCPGVVSFRGSLCEIFFYLGFNYLVKKFGMTWCILLWFLLFDFLRDLPSVEYTAMFGHEALFLPEPTMLYDAILDAAYLIAWLRVLDTYIYPQIRSLPEPLKFYVKRPVKMGASLAMFLGYSDELPVVAVFGASPLTDFDPLFYDLIDFFILMYLLCKGLSNTRFYDLIDFFILMYLLCKGLSNTRPISMGGFLRGLFGMYFLAYIVPCVEGSFNHLRRSLEDLGNCVIWLEVNPHYYTFSEFSFFVVDHLVVWSFSCSPLFWE